MTENFAGLFAAIRRDELQALRSLPWQNEALSGEALTAQFSNETGLTSLTGAIPFLQVDKQEIPKTANDNYLKSEEVAQFLVQNRALLRAYQAAAKNLQYQPVGDLTQAHLIHITTDVSGMEAANFAIFAAAQLSLLGQRILIIDADPQNQFVFPLLTFKEPPKLLTEQLQKPSTFKADLTKAIVTLEKNLSYLNLQAASLRPFDDLEIARLCGFLDADFDTLIFYAGRFQSPWLSANAHTNYAVCADTYKGELSAILRHAQGSHTVLLKKGPPEYLPRLAGIFSTKRPLEDWKALTPVVAALKEFVVKTGSATRVVIGGRENLPGNLHCHTGFDLYARLSGLEDADAEKSLNALQKRLRPNYPKSAFFGTRSVLSRVRNLPQRALTTILEVGEEPQLVSLVGSAELRATAIFPAGIFPAISSSGTRISAATSHGLQRFKTLAARGGFTSVLTAPRYRLQKPNALAAVMEQVQA